MKYSAPRGTRDILPNESPLWQFIEDTCRLTFENYNYREIRTPIFEATEVFTRSIGDSTDIVKKEMYTFPDRKGRSLTLRPEATASVVRAGLENNLISPDNLTKLYYIGPMFRYERPQAGRQRQFHQAGVEAFGSADPLLDAEVIQMSVRLLEQFGVNDLEVKLNVVGCKTCQPRITERTLKYFGGKIKDMCDDCKERFEKNPMRILDCKNEHCRKLIENVTIYHDICDNCRNHFDGVQEGLKQLGVHRVGINQHLVRGLDYYTRTAFEIVSKKLGAQNAVCGGGRYDNLVEDMGGKSVPGIGFAVGLERVIEIIKNEKIKIKNEGIDLFVATLGDEARQIGVDLVSRARASGISADIDYMGRSLKAQMKAADRLKAQYVYIIGEDELKKQSAVLKDMETAEQHQIAFGELIKHFAGECECGCDCQ